MTVAQALDRLASLAGIEDGWWDFFGNWRPVSQETKRAFLTAMGIDVSTDAAVQAGLSDLDNRSWRRWLDPVAVFDESWHDLWVPLTLPAAWDKQVVGWVLTEEGGSLHRGRVQVDSQDWIEERWLDGHLIKRWRLRLPGRPGLGYHDLTITAANGSSQSMRLIMAPVHGHKPPAIAEGRAWGIATQLYALRGASDWGVGTYGNLAELSRGAAALGAASIGVNPLHALFTNLPERFSPYSPSSRRFLNTTFIDVESLPEFSRSREARRMFASPGFQANLARIRSYPLVDYPDAAQLRGPVLETLFRCFQSEFLEPGEPRGQDFQAFVAAGGEALETFCLFEAVQRHLIEQGAGSYWRHWPEDWRRPDAPACRRFLAEHPEQVRFFAWLQFVADEQLAAAHRAGLDAGAAIGLYRDVGVGIADDGAEAWSEQDCLALGISVGAPPDPLALKGQNWGLVPFNPLRLREDGYAPFIAILAANMRHAGALRLDHAMSLQRLYWVPPGCPADQGAYVRYPVDDLFRLVALESRRNRCLVIGEDLGTVPEGFRERMSRADIFAYRVLVFEKTSTGAFKTPDEFDAAALAVASTHDLPSLRGWWNGSDIDRRETLTLYPRDGMAEEERAVRRHDRQACLDLLRGQGLVGGEFAPAIPVSDEDALLLIEAIHACLGRSRSHLMMVQIEDLLGLDLQMNVPGTTDQHPNWRRRFPLDVAALLADSRVLIRGESGRREGRDTCTCRKPLDLTGLSG